MSNIPGYIVVPLLGLIYAVFPGVLLMRIFGGFNTLSKVVTTIFLSLGFWICISWFISWVGLPLYLSTLFLHLLFITYFFATNSVWVQGVFSRGISFRVKQVPLHYWCLIVALVLLSLPLFFFTIPPGCDTAMHGYITRLIINNNGLPHSYRPILPVDYFGSYSAGYHIVTALVGGFNIADLRHAINFVSVIVYPLTLLGLVFALKNFFSEKTAIYTSIIFFGINRTYIGTIWWGGNPSMLSFASCLFSFGLFLYAVQGRNSKALYCGAFTIAAIPLVHAIPAITFAYIGFVGFLVLLYHFRERTKWIIQNSVVLIVGVLVLLLPFLLHFKNDNSPELILRIKGWQNEMMGKKLTNNTLVNLGVAAEQIKYRIGDVLTIVTGIALVFLFYFKRFKVIAYDGVFILYIYILVFNCSRWFLPFSELLYPERVVYFMVVCWAVLFGYFLGELENRIDTWVVKRKVTVYCIVVVALLIVSAKSIIDEETGLCREDQVSCNKPTVAAFDWINAHAEQDALFVASYADAGMWIPTFTNRATLGTHMHFIHEMQHVPDSLEASKAPRYFFITKRDIKMNKEIINKIGGRAKLFSNEEVTIYH